MSNKRRPVSPRLWIVSGPSGSGKTSLCEALLNDRVLKKRLMKSVSYTTRPKRIGEQEGRDYWHVSTAEFLRLVKRRAFLETQRIFGFYYGTPKEGIAVAKRRKRDLLLCIDVKGAQKVLKNFRWNAVSIFILPSKMDALAERLEKRSTENKKDIKKRLQRVKIELSYRKGYDHIVVNDDFDEALKKMKAIMMAG